LKGDIRLLAQCFVQGKVLELIEFAEVYHVHYHLTIIPLLGAVFFFSFVMWHGWRSSHNRFSLSGDDFTEDLALMAKQYEKTVKTVEN
jgi:hypothetical protein